MMMPLKELTLFGEVDKVQIAIERLKEFEPPEGYYLAFSGGKDSQCIYELAKMAGVKFDAHFNLTSVDPPEVIQFTKKYYPDVELHKPKQSMFQIIPKEMLPPTRLARYCCEELKEGGGNGRIVITGIRWEESYKRTKRRIFETCLKMKQKKHFLNPIIDWTTLEVWEFIKNNNLKYCKLYDEGYTRIGCIMCPMAGEKGMFRDAKKYPKFYKAYLLAFKKMLDNLNNNDKSKIPSWKTAEDVMHWWIYESKKKYVNPDQTIMFE